MKHRCKPIIERVLDKGIKHAHLPYNVPILPALQPDGSYRLVQDLGIITAAVVPDPYTPLSQIPSSTSHYTVLDLRMLFSPSLYTQNHMIYSLSPGRILTCVQHPSLLGLTFS